MRSPRGYYDRFVEGLVKSATDFFAAIFARFGFIGRPRRRAHISDDLKLLAELRNTEEFGAGSPAHTHLVDHIEAEIAAYSGVGITQKAWGSFWIAVILGVPLAIVTYVIDRDGWVWISLVPGLLAAFFLIGALGIAFGPGEDGNDEDSARDGPREAD